MIKSLLTLFCHLKNARVNPDSKIIDENGIFDDLESTKIDNITTGN
jgi:hypothetical protein